MIQFVSQNRRLLLEKIPFLILAMAVLISSLKAVAHQEMTVSFQTVPLSLRLENAATSFVAYLFKLSYPANLAVFHPFPASIPTWQVALSALLLGLLTGLAYYHRHCRPWLAFGWCWFLFSLIPVSGVIQAGLWPRMAYRWLYLPEIGLFLIFIWGLTELADRLNIGLRTRATGVVLILLLLMSSAYKQIQYWRDSSTLLKHALEAGGPHPVIYDYLGRALLTKKQPMVAIEYLKRSLEIDPGLDTALSDLGTAYALLNQLDLAIEYFEQALKINPDLADAGNNLKIVSQNKQRFEERANTTLKALGASPDSPVLLNRLGYDYFNLGRIQAATDCYEKSLRLDPGNKRAFNELGRIHLLYGKNKESLAFFKEALRIDPNFSEARQNLSSAERILSEIRE